MLRMFGFRLLLLVPVLFIVSIVTFGLVEMVPGDPAQQVLGPNSPPEEYFRVREELGLDRSWLSRYGDWLGNTLKGDLGKNLVVPIEDVWTKLSRAFPVSIQLALMAVSMALIVALPVAMYSAYKQGSRLDRLFTGTAFGLISVPSFLAGILIIFIFAIRFRWFPDQLWARPTERGWATNLKHAFLPALTIALSEIAVFTRLLRADLIATLQDDFVLAAKAKGMTARHIMLREALRPSSFSLITLAGVSLGRLIAGTVIVEQLFSLPGLGRVVVDGATKSDYTLVQGGVLFIATIYVLINFLIDILYGVLDPRIRRGR